MRNAFADQVTQLAKSNEKVVLLSGDIGNRLFDKYKAAAPTRFFNCGVAEANMIGMAAGLAMSGMRPIVYTINSFLIHRAYEQIRLDVCYHKAPVILVGVGAGLGYASLGPTHHSCEDIAITRSLPNMAVVCPGDPWEVRAALRAALNHNGPVFLRLGKKGESAVHLSEPDFFIGKGIKLKEGADVCLLSTGVMLPEVVKLSEMLASQKISCSIYSFHTVKPLDADILTKAFSNHKLVVTVEEHSLLGGFGSAVSEWMVQAKGLKANFLFFGTRDEFLHEACELEYAREHLGLGLDYMKKKILESLGG